MSGIVLSCLTLFGCGSSYLRIPEQFVPGLWSLDMRDDNVFDAWIDLNNVSDHTHELLEALTKHYEAMGALLPDDAAE